MGATPSIEKALSPKPCAVKEKHVQNVLDELLRGRTKFGDIWHEGFQQIQGGVEAQAWKLCYLLHYVMFHGFEYCSDQWPNQRKRQLKQLGKNYDFVVPKYVSYLQKKIEIHQKYKELPSDWDISFADFEKYVKQNNDRLDVILAMLNVWNNLINLKLTILEVMTNKPKLNTRSDKGQCFMKPVPLCFEESFLIRDLCYNIIFVSDVEETFKEHKAYFLKLDRKLEDCGPLAGWMVPERINNRLKQMTELRLKAEKENQKPVDVVDGEDGKKTDKEETKKKLDDCDLLTQFLSLCLNQVTELRLKTEKDSQRPVDGEDGIKTDEETEEVVEKKDEEGEKKPNKEEVEGDNQRPVDEKDGIKTDEETEEVVEMKGEEGKKKPNKEEVEGDNQRPVDSEDGIKTDEGEKKPNKEEVEEEDKKPDAAEEDNKNLNGEKTVVDHEDSNNPKKENDAEEVIPFIKKVIKTKTVVTETVDTAEEEIFYK